MRKTRVAGKERESGYGAKEKKGLLRTMLCPLFALILTVVSTGCARAEEQRIEFSPKAMSVGKNPYIGYVMDSRRAAGDRDTDLIYVETSLREIAPAAGQFDFSALEARCKLREWQALGKHIVLRFLMDKPSGERHSDIPDWLLAELKGGAEYDMSYGKGFSPDYAEERLIQVHREAILALGRYFSGYETAGHRNPDFVAFVELGSLGHWGEWHVMTEAGLPPMPPASVRQRYIAPYLSAFPKAKLLFRRPFSEMPESAGLYNDVSGDPRDTEEWLRWIWEGGAYNQTGEEMGLSAMPERYRTAPVGGEFTSAISMRRLMVQDFGQTRELIRQSHSSLLGPKIPFLSEAGGMSQRERSAFSRNTDSLEAELGYRYRLRELSYDAESGKLSLTVRNDGNAPIYFEYRPVLYFGERRIPLELSLKEIAGGEERTVSITWESGRRIHSLSSTDAGLGISQDASSQLSSWLSPEASSEISAELASDAAVEQGQTLYFAIENVDNEEDRLSLPMRGGENRKYPILRME